MLTELIGIMPLALFSVLSLWKPNPVLFMVAAGIAIATGLAWYDQYTTGFGLSVALMMVTFSLYCLGMAFRMLFWRETED